MRPVQCLALGTVHVSKGDGRVGVSAGGGDGIQHDAGDRGDGTAGGVSGTHGGEGNGAAGGGGGASALDSSH